MQCRSELLSSWDRYAAELWDRIPEAQRNRLARRPASQSRLVGGFNRRQISAPSSASNQSKRGCPAGDSAMSPRSFQPKANPFTASFRDARMVVRTAGESVCDVKERCRERNAMDAEKRWRERRRMEARDDVDEGVGCGGVAWVSGSAGCGVSERAGSPPAPARGGYRASRDRETSPAAGPASAPLAAGACAPRGSDAGTSAEPRRARRFPAPASTDLPAPALGRTPRLQRRSPATRPRLRALGRAPHGVRGILCVCEGAIPAAQRPTYSGLAWRSSRAGGANVGQRVPARLPEVGSGET